MLQIEMVNAGAEDHHKGDRRLCGGGDELDVVVIVERHVNGRL